MSKIKNRFEQLAVKGEKALIAYIMAGDPNLSETCKIVLELEKAGADFIELGVPFTDPVADGPTIQKAAERALHQGVTLPLILEHVANLRRKTTIPILLMTYLNPIFAMGRNAVCGLEHFFKEARRVGVDGVIIPDLPLEEAKECLHWSRRYRVDLIFLVAPTTPLERVEKIASYTTGFLYYVSITGITGASIKNIASVTKRISEIKSLVKIPVVAGFGISTGEEAKAVSRVADGVVVGSLFVKTIETAKQEADILPILYQQTASLKAAILS
jgi:tryptophan synthase alpha chain